MALLIMLFIFYISGIHLLIASECPIYTCTKLDRLTCSVNSDTNNYKLQECPDYFKCDFQVTGNSSCVINKYEYDKAAYPGGFCKKPSDCLSNNCIKEECQGMSDNKCDSNKDCTFDSHCQSNQCIGPGQEGEECTKDEDCIWPFGCFNSKCTQFFSIDNKKPGDDNMPYFCKSGKSYNNICNSISDSNDSNCDDSVPCKYMSASDEIITIDNACVCTISSSEPKKICKPGDLNNPYWMKVLAHLKESINTKYPNTCNAEEKRPGFCRESLRNNWDVRNKNIELNKSLILAQNAGRISQTAPCSLKSVLQFDDTPPKPKNGVFKCPEYECEETKLDFDDETCAYSFNPFNENGNDIQVHLNNICEKGFKCNYKSDNVFLNWTVNSTCEEIPTHKSWRYKYPGEECTSHSQCLKGSKDEERFCIDGICSGMKEKEDCEGHRDCIKGYFCNGLKCQQQKKEKDFCLESFECRNYLGCLNNTCVGYYSLPNGTYLNKTNPDKTLCKMGIVNEETNQCAETDYYEIDSRQKDENGFVECIHGQLCNYTTGFYKKDKLVVTTSICECGFREKGRAYCPIPQTVSKSLIS